MSERVPFPPLIQILTNPFPASRNNQVDADTAMMTPNQTMIRSMKSLSFLTFRAWWKHFKDIETKHTIINSYSGEHKYIYSQHDSLYQARLLHACNLHSQLFL